MIPCIPGVTQLQEVGRTQRVIGYHGKQDNRDVIVELFRGESQDEAWFFRSSALQSRLAQAAIPTFIEVGRIEGRPYRLREYVQGRPAQQLLSDGPLSEERLIALARGVASALKSLHQRGFIHGYLTLDHLRVDRSGVFRLLDAGVCRPIGSPWQPCDDNVVWSSDHYRAPELQPGVSVEPSADLYSLGAVLLDLAVGYHVGERTLALTHLELRPALSHLLSALLDEPQRRPSASAVLLALVNLEKWEASLRLGQSLPFLQEKEYQHPYPLCGRGPELGLLQQAWTQSQERSLRVYLVGARGSGRSRLCEELRRGLAFADLSRVRVADSIAAEAGEAGPGLTLVCASAADPLPSQALRIDLQALDPAQAVQLSEAFLNGRAPSGLQDQLIQRSWLPGELLEQLEQWCSQGMLRPFWGRWRFGDEAFPGTEPLRLTACMPSLDEQTLNQVLVGLRELQSASLDPIDQMQALTRALERVLPCARSAAWVALEQGLVVVSGSPEEIDVDLLRQALQHGYPRQIVEPYACLALPLVDGEEVLGGVALMRANPFLGVEIELAERLGRQTHQELRRARLFGEQQRLLEITRHRFLTAQIRPHFLFNALNTLAALIPVEPELAESLTLDTAEFLRTTFADRPDQVSLAEEVQLVEVYLRLEKARFGNRLHMDLQLDPQANSLLLPTLTLQPLVENAVRHGITSRAEGGRICLRVSACPQGFEITLEDDGVGFDPARVRPKGTGVGLSNVRERLVDLYGSACQWTLRSAPGQGTFISFRVPCP